MPGPGALPCGAGEVLVPDGGVGCGVVSVGVGWVATVSFPGVSVLVGLTNRITTSAINAARNTPAIIIIFFFCSGVITVFISTNNYNEKRTNLFQPSDYTTFLPHSWFRELHPE
jgi:ABC-type amino acid transport system permease subunit